METFLFFKALPEWVKRGKDVWAVPTYHSILCWSPACLLGSKVSKTQIHTEYLKQCRLQLFLSCCNRTWLNKIQKIISLCVQVQQQNCPDRQIKVCVCLSLSQCSCLIKRAKLELLKKSYKLS